MVWFGDSAEKESTDPAKLTPSSEGWTYKQFRKRLHEEILRSQRCTHTFTLMRVSLGTFENAVPDHLEDVLKSAIREYDLLCSVKPTEYFIAFPETSEKHAEVIAERIRRQVVTHQDLSSGATLSLEASIGIACFPQDGTNTEDLLHSAEQDLKQARRAQRLK